MAYICTVCVHEPLEGGRESSLGIKELFNQPPLVLKGGAPQWFCSFARRLGVPGRYCVVPLSFRTGQ